MNAKSKKGFTLVEIMIVVVIIGLLAAMAIPAFQKVQKVSETSEEQALRRAEHPERLGLEDMPDAVLLRRE